LYIVFIEKKFSIFRQEEFELKKLMVLFVVCFVVFAGSVAFAGAAATPDTVGYANTPNPAEYTFGGGVTATVQDISQAASVLAPAEVLLLNQELLDLASKKHHYTVAVVSLAPTPVPAGAMYNNPKKHEKLFNFNSGGFMDAPAGPVDLVALGFVNQATGAVVSIRDDGKSGGGGCTAFPFVAVLMFVIPAFVFLKRGKK